jgi:hypothetical protein
MRIRRTTNQQLVVMDSSVWISIVLLCLAASMATQAVALQTPKWWILVGCLSLFALIAWRREIVTFDAARQEVRWVRRRAFKLARGSLPFNEMRGITIDSTSGKNASSIYRLTILTTDKPVPMSDVYSGGEAYYVSIRKQILEFLNFDNRSSSPGPGDEASIRSLLSEGRRVDAIQFMQTQYQLDMEEAVDRVNEIDQKMKATQ